MQAFTFEIEFVLSLFKFMTRLIPLEVHLHVEGHVCGQQGGLFEFALAQDCLLEVVVHLQGGLRWRVGVSKCFGVVLNESVLHL